MQKPFNDFMIKSYVVQRDVSWEQHHTEDGAWPVSQEEQDLATNGFRHVIEKPLNEIPDEAKGGEVRDVHDHVSLGDLQRLYDAHAIIRDVDHRDAVRDQCWENTQLRSLQQPPETFHGKQIRAFSAALILLQVFQWRPYPAQAHSVGGAADV